ncbi:MAG TPA: OmpA family protein [Gemmatimonadales bacterium]|nr:OmpA family protein [Gemmatimonadales bacterium]
MKPFVPVALLQLLAITAVRGQDFKAYQNYDFVPGDRIIFEDDFRSDTDGEFPAHWKLLAGQAVVNKFQDEPVFALTDGNYARVAPRIKTDAYLSDPFTVEFDFYPKSGGFAHIVLFLTNADGERQLSVGDEIATSGFEHDLAGSYPGGAEAFVDKWHHVALVYQKDQLKCYLDQYRVLVMPDAGFVPTALYFAGIGDQENPVLFKNVRIASGGGMNLIDKLLREGKLVSHGILFDVNQSTIKPQSMGTIGEIVKLLQQNPALKLEIGGHTDSDGDAAKNLALSQARADAVKRLLLAAGIDASRLSSKGYGASKPVEPNTTPEGKANNRRVEFIKI